MDIKEIKEQLKKEKDSEKFLRKLLKNIKDKKLKEEVEKLLEKKETRGESELERAVRNVHIERREPKLTAEVPEIDESFEERTTTIRGVRPDLIVGRREEADYGLRTGGRDYAVGSAVQKLKSSNLVAEQGHLGTAETQELIDKKMGEYEMRSRESDKYREDKIYSTTQRESFSERTAFDNVLGTDRDKKKKRLGDYV